MKKECPVCGKYTYTECSGEYDIPDESGAKKLSPDIGQCSNCGFFYSEHIKHPIEEQVKDYKKTAHCRKCGDEISGDKDSLCQNCV